MRRRLPFSRTLFVLTAGLAAAAIATLGLGRMDRVVVARGRLAGGTVPVVAAADSVVVAVEGSSGQEVKLGDVLLRLDAEPLQAELAVARTRVAALEGRVDDLRQREERLKGEVRASELAEAEREVERARLRLEGAERRAKAMDALDEQGLVANLDRHDAELERRLAEVALAAARELAGRLEVELESRLLELRSERGVVEGERDEVLARIAELERLVDQALVRAPEDGVLLLEPGRELLGRAVRRGDELGRVAVAPPTRFEGVVPDLGRPHVRSGLFVKVRLDAYPWLLHGSVPGTLEDVSDRHGDLGGFPAVVRIEPDGPGPLYDGMTGQARIVVEGGVSIARLLFEQVVGRDGP